MSDGGKNIGARPKRHHVVPKFYLRRFAVNDRVQLVSRDEPRKTFVTSVDNALVQKDFYSIDTEAGRETDVEEFVANQVEPGAARALRRMVDEGAFPPPRGVRDALSRFLAFQFVRGASLRSALTEHYEVIAKKIGSLMTEEMARRHLLESDGVEPSDEDVRGLVEFAHDTDGYRVGVGSEANLHLGLMLKVALDLIPYFAKRSWQLLQFSAPLLVTGDEPVALVDRTATPGSEPLGLAGAQEIVFTADPAHALILVRPDRSKTEATRVGTPDMARLINRHVGFASHEYLVHAPGTEPLKGLHFAKKRGPVEVHGDHVLLRGRPARRTARGRGFQLPPQGRPQ